MRTRGIHCYVAQRSLGIRCFLEETGSSRIIILKLLQLLGKTRPQYTAEFVVGVSYLVHSMWERSGAAQVSAIAEKVQGLCKAIDKVGSRTYSRF